MGADPLGQRLTEAGFRVGVVRCPQNRDEDFTVARLTCNRIEHRNGVAGEIHEQLLACRMRLAHGRRDAATPFAVKVAKTGCSHIRQLRWRDTPPTAALASRRAGAARHGYGSSQAAASSAKGCSLPARTACAPAPCRRARLVSAT